MRGINDSAPSIPNLFIPGYLDAKNFASPSAAPSRLRMYILSSFENLFFPTPGSNLD